MLTCLVVTFIGVVNFNAPPPHYAFAKNAPPLRLEDFEGKTISKEEKEALVERIITSIYSVDDDYDEMQMLDILRCLDIRDDRVMQIYIKILKNKRHDISYLFVRHKVTKNLLSLGKDARPALPVLAEALRNTNFKWSYLNDWRDRAAEVIGNVGPPVDDDIIAALITGAKNGQNWNTCTSHCIHALEKLGDKGITGLLRLVEYENSEVSEEAISALLEKPEDKREALLEAINRLEEPRKSERLKYFQECSEHKKECLNRKI